MYIQIIGVGVGIGVETAKSRPQYRPRLRPRTIQYAPSYLITILLK